MRRTFLALVAVAAALAVATPAALAGEGGVIYDSTVTPLPGNLPSVGAEAYSFTELGDGVAFAHGPRHLGSLTVTLSSWGCQSGHWYTADCVTSPGAQFEIPITLNLYRPGANGTAGGLLATRSQTFQVPYRPSSDPACTGGRWLDGAQGCFNGLATNVIFDFAGQHVALPDTMVYGISYNTSHYGPKPVGQGVACYTSSGGCPYDSLNIALAPSVVVGSKPFPDTLYQNAVYAGDYCDNGAAGVGVMRLDSPSSACWAGFIPAVRFAASSGEGAANGGGAGK